MDNADVQKEETQKLTKIEEARQVAERLEKANAEYKALIERQEAMKANEMLGGEASAGHESPQMTEEEKRKQATKEFWKGSMIEKAIEKYG